MKTFRTYQLAKEFYQQTKGLVITGPMRDQFRRASLSILLNLSEGSAKPTVKDRKKFYFIAFGSLREVQCMLDMLGDMDLIEKADVLAAHMYKLCHH
jgi:four helix bundle protein